MKKNNFWENIKNGLKKAVTFVVDVLLFIPRFLINGIKGFFSKEESESEEIVEEFDDKAEEKSEANKPVETEESKQEETVAETATEEKSNSVEETDDKAEEKSEAEKPVETEESKQEETVAESTDKKVEVKITVAAAKEPQATETTINKTEEKSVEATEEQPKQEATDDKAEEKSEANKPVETEESKQEETVAETATEEKSNSVEETDDKAEEKSEAEKPVEDTEKPKQEVTEEPQKSKKSNNKKASAKTTTKVEKVVAEVVDNQTGKVVKDNVNVEASTGEKEMPVFAKTDKKAAPFEKGFITYFNGAVKKYNKSLWLDGATEIQKFAKAYLDAIAIKENINAPKDETRYEDIMKALKDAKIMSDPDEKFLKSCLGKQYFQGTENVQERLNAVYVFMGNYQMYYYPEWCASVKPQPFNPDGVATA